MSLARITVSTLIIKDSNLFIIINYNYIIYYWGKIKNKYLVFNISLIMYILLL